MSDSDRSNSPDAGAPNDDSRLQADAQYGLKFVSQTTPEDAFAIRADDAPSPASAPTPNPNDGPTVAPPAPSSEPEIYGVAEPDVYGLAEPLPTPSQPAPLPPKNDAPRSKKKKTPTTFDDAPRDAEYSLEEIYERKRREREENGDDEYVRGERPELPARPFLDRIMKPFCSISFLLRLGIISGLAFIPLFLATWLFSKHFSYAVAEMLEKNEELGALTAFFRCVWADKVIFSLFCFGWGVFSIPHSFHIFSETAAGADDIDEWPEYNFIGGLGQFLWLTALVGIAGVPGAFLFGVLGLNPLVGFTLSGTILTPFFFLGCMQTDTLFGLATKETLASLKRVGKSWLNFYFIAFAFLFGTVGLSLAAIGAVVSAKGSASRAVFAAAVISLIFSFIPALYLRFLGRLAWIIEDDVRRRAEEEAEDDDSDEEADA